MNILTSIENTGIQIEKIAEKKQAANRALDVLWSGKMTNTGWVQAPLKEDKAELDYILNVADIVKTEANLLVVIGAGNSYIETKAAIEALPNVEDGIEVLFAGMNYCDKQLSRLMDEMSRRETVLCVVAEKEELPEVRAAFEILKDLMLKKYGSKEAVNRRIITITNKNNGTLQEETKREGYVTFEIPEAIGAGYASITPAGLFPMAVAGIDIRGLIQGQKDAAMSPDWDKDATNYAIARQIMLEQGRNIESVNSCDTSLTYMGKWMKHMYGEDECGTAEALFFKTNNQNLFETIISVERYDSELVIPAGEMAGRSLEELNREAMQKAKEEHIEAGVPIIEISIPKLDAYNFGQLAYFLQTTGAITKLLREG